jgi:seryl-tRNA synthetase
VLEPSGAAITAQGKCFRYESTNLSGLERLWDFTMREVVFLGTAERVAQRRQDAIAAVMDQLERWDLDGTVVTANDPFFPTTYATKRYWQLAAEMKFELRLPVEGVGDAPRTLAACSFNIHEAFFGDAFHISNEDGAPACTSCVGWGLERWVLACFAQHGFDRTEWPLTLRDIF